MRQAPSDGAARRHHRLPDHLPAEYPLPARLRAGAAKHVHLDRLEIENGNQINQAFGHKSASKLLVIPGRGQRRRTRNLEIPGSREDACPGMTISGPRALASLTCFAQL